MFRSRLFSMLSCAASMFVLGACAAPTADDAPAEAAQQVQSSSQELTESVISTGDADRPPHADLDTIYTREHLIPIGRGRRVHVTEKFTLRSWLRHPQRSVMILPGQPVKASFYDLHVEGYGLQRDLARAGFFAFAVDYEGTGGSSYPANGLSVTHEFLVGESRRVLEAVRAIRGVRRVDMFGASVGGAVASELCADAARTRTCVMSSMLYRTGSDYFNAVFLDPVFLAFLRNQPNGYILTTAPLYFNIIARSPPLVAADIVATQQGLYPVGPLLAPADGLPWFDPTRAAVPGLIVQGSLDNIPAPTDADDLRASYGSRGGGVAELVRIEGAGHIPYVEAAPFPQQFKTAVLDFLNSH